MSLFQPLKTEKNLQDTTLSTCIAMHVNSDLLYACNNNIQNIKRNT